MAPTEAGVQAPPRPSPYFAAPPDAPKSWFRRHWKLVTVGAVAALIGVSAAAGGGSKDETSADAPPAREAPASTTVAFLNDVQPGQSASAESMVAWGSEGIPGDATVRITEVDRTESFWGDGARASGGVSYSDASMALSAERKDAIAADVRDWSLIASACEDYEDLPDTDAGDCYVEAPDSGRGSLRVVWTIDLVDADGDRAGALEPQPGDTGVTVSPPATRRRSTPRTSRASALTIVTGPAKAEIVTLVSSDWPGDPLDLLGVPATLTARDAAPSVDFEPWQRLAQPGDPAASAPAA